MPGKARKPKPMPAKSPTPSTNGPGFDPKRFVEDAWQRHREEVKREQTSAEAEQSARDLQSIVDQLLKHVPKPSTKDAARQLFSHQQAAKIVRVFCTFGESLRSRGHDQRLEVIATACQEKRFAPQDFELRLYQLAVDQKRKALRGHLALLFELPMTEQRVLWRRVLQFTDSIIHPPWPPNHTGHSDLPTAWPRKAIDHVIKDSHKLWRSNDPVGQLIDRCEQLLVGLETPHATSEVDLTRIDAEIRDVWLTVRRLRSKLRADPTSVPEEPKKITSLIEARQAIDSALRWAATLRRLPGVAADTKQRARGGLHRKGKTPGALTPPSAVKPNNVGPFSFEPGGFTFRGKKTELAGKPLQVLQALANAKGRALLLDELRVLCWGPDSNSGEESIRSTVRKARNALRTAMEKAGVTIPESDPIPNVDRGTKRTAWRLKLS